MKTKQNSILYTLVIFLVLGISVLVPTADGLLKNKEYVILSEKFFIVFALDKEKQISVIDGGVLYHEKWHMMNMTSVIVDQWDDEGEIAWVIGELESGERVWVTWNLTINNDVVSGAWVYDGKTLTEMPDHDAYMTRLFY